MCSPRGLWLDAGVRAIFNRINMTFGKVHFSEGIGERLRYNLNIHTHKKNVNKIFWNTIQSSNLILASGKTLV